MTDATHLKAHRTACSLLKGEKFSEGIPLLDATWTTLPKGCADWCRHIGSQCGAKLHVIYDPDQQLPLKAEVSPGSINDITPAKSWEIEPNTTRWLYAARQAIAKQTLRVDI